MSNLIPADPSQADPSIVALMHGLKQQESGGDYNKIGDEGTASGSGQWSNEVNGKPQKLTQGQIPANFQADAKQYGLDPTDFSPDNQNKVMYASIAKDKQAGLTPEQILSKWNSGDPNKYLSTEASGTGPVGKYDVASYVKNAMQYAQQYAQKNKGGGGFNPKPFSSGFINFGGGEQQPQAQATPSDTLGGELQQRGQQATSAINSIVQGEPSGSSRVSGLLQLGGAVGGAIGDVTNKALELIPGVKGLENLLGKGVGALAQTPAGQSVAKSIQSFSQAHPELSKDIGAGFNIVTALPILDGLKAVGGVTSDAVSQGLKGIAEKGLQNDLEGAAGKTVGGRKILSQFPDIAQTIVDERAVPTLKNGKFITEDASKTINASIGKLDDQLQSELEKANIPAVSSRIPITSLRQSAIQDAIDNLIPKQGVDSIFDAIQEKYGNYLTLQQANEAKRSVAKQIAESAFGDPAASARKIVRSTLQSSVEDGASQLGLADVGEINQKMRKLINAQKLLDTYINGKKPLDLGIGKIVRNVPVIGGASEDTLQGIKSKVQSGILKRTGKGAVKTSLKTAAKKAGLMAGISAGKSALSK